jgi:hypothetical protein
MCLDSDIKNMSLSGSEVSTNSETIIFEINRCNNDDFAVNETKKCHSEKEIDEYLENITVETWANYKKIDFRIHNDKPTRRF